MNYTKRENEKRFYPIDYFTPFSSTYGAGKATNKGKKKVECDIVNMDV